MMIALLVRGHPPHGAAHPTSSIDTAPRPALAGPGRLGQAEEEHQMVEELRQRLLL